jgi:hypothetical protein
MVWVASFDPGKCNFAFSIEDIPEDALKQIKNIPKSKRYDNDGQHTKEYAELINKALLLSKTVLVRNTNVNGNTEKSKYLDTRVFVNITDLLDQYKSYWNKCSIILIEQQMSFKKGHNTMALKIAQHVFSYFTFCYSTFKEILEFPAYHKTKILGAPKKLTKPQRKKWAIEKANQIWVNRNDNEIINYVKQIKKKDDLSDCFLMCNCFGIMRYITGEI